MGSLPYMMARNTHEKFFSKGLSAFYYRIFKHTERLYELYSKELKPTI